MEKLQIERTVDFKGELKPLIESEKVEYLSPINNRIFKGFFLQDKNRKYMCKLISHFTPFTYEELLAEMVVYHNYLKHADMSQKDEISDFVGRIKNCIISVEMNNSNTLARNVEYSDRLYAMEVNHGQKSYEYLKIWQINLNNFRFKKGKSIVEDTVEVYRTQSDYGELYIQKEYTNISLVNISNKYYNEGINSLSEEERCVLLMFDTDKNRVNVLKKGNKLYMDYVEDLQDYIVGYGLKEAYDHEEEERKTRDRWARERAQEQGHKEGLEQGLKQGLERGLEQGLERGLERGLEQGLEQGLENGRTMRSYEIANSMYKEGVPLDSIKRYTGITLIEDQNPTNYS